MTKKSNRIRKVENVNITYVSSHVNTEYEDGYEDDLLSVFTSKKPTLF